MTEAAKIMKDIESAYLYARDVIKGRWIQGEKFIKEHPAWACSYAEEIIKGRFVEAEDVIKTDPVSAFLYARYVIKDRWIEGENEMKNDPCSAYLYARDIIHGKLPEDMHNAMIIFAICPDKIDWRAKSAVEDYFDLVKEKETHETR